LYKKYLDFGRNIFILSKIGSPTLSSNFLAWKVGPRKGYGGLNIGEKEF
jgi:hypothetical protein